MADPKRARGNGTTDDIDRRIIELLCEDGRMPIQDIAKEISSTAATVRARIRRLEEAKVLRVVAVTDFAAAGYDLLIAIGIEVESRSPETVGNELAKLPEVFSVNITTGVYDLEMLVAARDFDDLNRFLTVDLARIKGIGKLAPALATNVLKYQSEWAPEL